MQHPPTKRKAMTNKRTIILTSDCGNYTIKAKLVAESDCYTQDNYSGHKCYTGSHWNAGIYMNGKPVKGIQVRDGNYQPFITIHGVCSHGMKLNKNTILFIAHTTGMFKNALSDIDTKKVERKYYKEYIAARVADGTL